MTARKAALPQKTTQKNSSEKKVVGKKSTRKKSTRKTTSRGSNNANRRAGSSETSRTRGGGKKSTSRTRRSSAPSPATGGRSEARAKPARRKRGGKKANTERLHKFIANCGYCSRRRAEILIDKGLVKVNATVAEPGLLIVPGRDVVTIHGEQITPPAPLTLILNKPSGYITSTHDTHERLTVMDLLPKKLLDCGVLPAGRLDLETEGLLVFTNDGDLQHRITHPSFECEKEYKVHINRPPTAREKERLEKGVYLEELQKWTSDARVLKLRKRPDGSATLHVFISEGMKRQVRRMFKSLDITVLHLDRLAIAGVQLDTLKRGEWRKLTDSEVRSLRGDDPSPKSTSRRRKS